MGTASRGKAERVGKKTIAAALICSMIGGGLCGLGGAALYQRGNRGETVVYEGGHAQVETVKFQSRPA